jgi:hypothetical protein
VLGDLLGVMLGKSEGDFVGAFVPASMQSFILSIIIYHNSDRKKGHDELNDKQKDIPFSFSSSPRCFHCTYPLKTQQ